MYVKSGVGAHYLEARVQQWTQGNDRAVERSVGFSRSIFDSKEKGP
jgi:membrane-bound inhibitor of C-type lysozyme